MSDNYEDQFDWDDAVGSGLLDEYVGTISNAEFGTDPEYNDGETVRLMVDIVVDSHDEPDVDIDPGDTVEEAFNVGHVDTWEILDNGEGVAKVDGKRIKFNNNSGYGRLIASVNPRSKTAMEGADKLAEILQSRGPGNKADIWEGLTFRFKRLEFSFTPKGEDEVVYYRTYPVEFLGENGADTSSSKGKSKGKSKSKDDDNEGPSRADLLALAAEHETYSKFLAAAMSKYPGVEDGEHAEDLMREKDGIFAEAHE